MHNRLALKLVAPAELPDDAFGCALADTSTALGRHARRLTGRVPDADDLVQATVARCWAAPSSFRAGANLAAWARTIMRDSSISGRRRALPDATHPHNLLDRQSGDEGEQEERMHLRDVDRAMRDPSIHPVRAAPGYERACSASMSWM